jgi:hypothetical protein
VDANAVKKSYGSSTKCSSSGARLRERRREQAATLRRADGRFVMSAELALAGVVRCWVDAVLPGETGAATAAVAAALTAYGNGASFDEACEAAQVLVGCWTRHPSRPAGRRAA